ncbi:MAG: hypothetical protein E7077_09275 [Bacteroidales bacterium]|nr:hypothetical protein [Bacteroidales bacterium]
MISKIHKFYRYFVYRIFHFNNDSPEINVMVFLGMVHGSIVLAVLIILDILFDVGFPPNLDKSEWYLLALLFFALQFLIFFRPSKWKTYFKEFENESKEEKRKGTILVWGYIIFSSFSPIYIPVIWDAFFR